MSIDKCYSDEEQIKRTGIVVEQFNEIENMVNTIIFDYITPTIDAEQFVKTYLLDNSILSFASKIKLLQVIARNIKAKAIDRNKLHRLMAIRNAFAHNQVAHRIDIEHVENELPDIYYYIESIKGNGEMERFKRDNVFAEFGPLHNDLKQELQNFYGLVNLRG